MRDSEIEREEDRYIYMCCLTSAICSLNVSTVSDEDNNRTVDLLNGNLTCIRVLSLLDVDDAGGVEWDMGTSKNSNTNNDIIVTSVAVTIYSTNEYLL